MKTIITNIKFYKGVSNVENKIYGFVTKHEGHWRGCRVDTEKKKVVLVDPQFEKDIVPNVLYRCSLIPMKSGGGFIAIEATPCKAKAHLEITQNAGRPKLIVSFGYKRMIYDPSSPNPKKNNISAIADDLRNRHDLEDAHIVAQDFIDNACIVRRIWKQHEASQQA